MADPEVSNWFGDLISHPRVIVDVNAVADIVAVLKDPSQYPAPVRAVGSNHSTAPCGVADGGTLLRMKMNRILHIGTDTMTVEAGARHIDMAPWNDWNRPRAPVPGTARDPSGRRRCQPPR